MSEEITPEALQALLREQVEEAGGPKKWGKKHPLLYSHYVYHMYADGSAATDTQVAAHLGYEKVTMYRRIPHR